ncbi:hypothetical protein H7K45_24470 [Mycobacterium yunnanensis]|uniref:Uncharacterized protein n=1 Tax=Mycobacterium yunnanensis TaxID=368477 RepID=A0A9X3C326_9MYCO|nr:hypothetical protein [Mycobacterium yunnanensis]MCV7423713.1 hypothetical protein [Mycobacterium yunnanensis]
MTNQRLKSTAAAVGACAVATAAAIVGSAGPAPHQAVAGGSGDSATTTMYTQPVVTAMKLASTTTETVALGNDDAPTAMATPEASPSVKATFYGSKG